ncbi:hypothetical protein FRC12_005472 [Ceratobasidium sp. 428]|nr:hypothetical protein FRC12_005472 [Ceratobasidium sp. 428]
MSRIPARHLSARFDQTTQSSAAASRVHGITELWHMACCFFDSKSRRAITQTCTLNAERVTPLVWRQLYGFGNLLAILHDSFRVSPERPGGETIPMLELDSLEQARIDRFLQLSAYVIVMHEHARPQQWVDWTHLERLLPLVTHAGDRRSALMPNVQEAFLSVDGWDRRPFSPFVQLFAGPSLRTLVVVPPSNTVYTQLTAKDTAKILELATIGINPGSDKACALGIFPDEKSSSDREAILTVLPRSSTPLTTLSISAWMLSPETFLLLAQYYLVNLYIHGRFSANPADLTLLPDLEIPETSFIYLRNLVINEVAFSDVVHILRTPHLVDRLEVLRLDIASILNLDLDDTDEDNAYKGLIDQVTKAKHLKQLSIVSPRDDAEGPYSLTPEMVKQLRDLELSRLRLSNFAAGDGVGFHDLRENAAKAWVNLTQLSMLSQDLLPGDLVALSQLPKLWRIAANVSPMLGRRFDEGLGRGFSRQLQLVSHFKFGADFSEPEATAENRRALHRIIA